jgi:uncharacterized RDD family membrane protein YckC
MYAGFWVRFVAYIIDTVIVEVGAGLVTLGLESATGPDQGATYGGGLGLLLGLLYWSLLESSPLQATLGKMALGLKVTDLEGRRLSFPRALGRTLAKLLSTLLFMIGYLMVGWTARKQGLHDLIAGTLVVKAAAAPQAQAGPTGPLRSGPEPPSQGPASGRLSGRAPDHPTPR